MPRQYSGSHRPPFALTPAEGQESVWDYPRPPRIADDTRLVVVRAGDIELARTRRSRRVLETASPPTFYLPPEDVHMDLLVPAPGTSFCEWKGEARYWTVVAGALRIERAAWSYALPQPGFESIRDHIAFYANRVECFVEDERVRPQPGQFYGGWVTSDVVGPFKGEPGTAHW